MKECELYKSYKDYVECLACARRCKLKPNQLGFCGIRKNIDGKLFLLNYGFVSAIHIDPVEKKPAIHFYPGHKILSIGGTGCNWACAYCQNFEISQRRRVDGKEIMPEELIELAKGEGAIGIAYTYNEPSTLIEFAKSIGTLAHKNGLKNYFVSNGYFTDESIEYALSFLDGITIDFKGHGETNFMRKYTTSSDSSPIFNAIEKFFGKIYLEITDLVIPGIGDSEDALKEMLANIAKVSTDIPIHFLRFFPDYKLANLYPTPISTLEKCYNVARDLGFKYVYIGNVPGHKFENTYCPNCGSMVIGRFGFEVTAVNLDEDNRCKNCGFELPIIGRPKLNYEPIYSLYDLYA
ncbi:MAG: AmmeMemoRadiSam system radical SAM enzyme [Conexivisphaerales archaeon]